ncbi:50S ribosomal protein L15e [uncultured archaeon]|nr:50S ribosomal protein L15e [uncultured archaeon]
MSFAKNVSETFQMEAQGEKTKDYDYSLLYRQRVMGQRKAGGAVMRLDKPSNIARARSLGYKAKQGIFVCLVRVARGSGLHRRPSGGRRPKMMGVLKLTRRISKKSIAEKKAGKKFPNCEVLNSYWSGEDGRHYYFEVIMVDTSSPSVMADPGLNWICSPKNRGRAERGLTSAGKKSRGLKRGRGHEKNFPSQRAHHRKAK